MTPLPLALATTPEQSSSSPPPAQQDRPERSRNAKAQARHRAKRKAYIEQLEQTVTKLQYALSLSPDQVAALPPPIIRIRELEEENQQLVRQIEELREQLENRNTRLRTGPTHRSAVLPTFDDRGSDHDTVKRRRTMEGSDDLTMMGHSPVARQNHSPLQVSIPRDHNTYGQQTAGYHQSPSTPMMQAAYPVQYQFPETQSPSMAGSPATSFSASIYVPSQLATHFSDTHYSPSLMHPQSLPHNSGHSPHHSGSSYSAMLHPYTRASNQYDPVVKIEEESYPVSHGLTQAQTNGYASALSSFGGSNPGMGSWHGYPTGA